VGDYESEAGCAWQMGAGAFGDSYGPQMTSL
jgi:hypothetical protein